MSDLVERLRKRAKWPFTATQEIYDEAADALEAQAQEIERLYRALHDIREEWAGAECGEPVTCQEAYAIGLAKRMYALAVEGLSHT